MGYNSVFSISYLSEGVTKSLISPSKSSFLNYSQSECEMIALNGFTCIDRNYYTKFLGVIINEKLHRNEHIKSACSKIISYCYGLFKTRTILNVICLKIYI